MRGYLAIWWRAYAIVCCTTANVVNISHERVIAAFVTGGVLSLIWWGNSRTAAHANLTGAAWIYGFGAACGTVTGMYVARWL